MIEDLRAPGKLQKSKELSYLLQKPQPEMRKIQLHSPLMLPTLQLEVGPLTLWVCLVQTLVPQGIGRVQLL